MACGYGYVQCVHCGTIGKARRMNQLSCKHSRLVRNAEGRNIHHPLCPPARGLGVARRGLGYHNLGYIHFEFESTTIPPLVRGLLPSGNDQVAARVSREVTDDLMIEVSR